MVEPPLREERPECLLPLPISSAPGNPVQGCFHSGHPSNLVLDSRIEPLEIGFRFLLCSDGLYRSVADAEMADILSRADCEEAAEALLALSLSRQPTDNVTLGVVQSADGDVVSVTESLF